MPDLIQQAQPKATLVFNLETRQVEIPASEMGMGPEGAAIVGVSSDESVLPVRICAKRFYRGYDLSTFEWRVNYANPLGEGDVFRAADVVVGEDAIEFTWLLSRFATANAGLLTFVICAVRCNGEREIDQEINSTVAQLEVLDGFEVDEDADMAARLDWLGAAVDDLIVPIQEAERQRAAAEGLRIAAEAARTAAEESREEAEALRAAAEAERMDAEAQRQLQFDDMVDSFADGQVLILEDGRFDEAGVPNFEGTPGVVYCAPAEIPFGADRYVEWIWADGWEKIGMDQASLVAVSDSTIDAIAADGDVPDGSEVITQTGLKRLWFKIKAWTASVFAEKQHDHTADQVRMGESWRRPPKEDGSDSGSVPDENGLVAITAEEAMSNLRDSISQGYVVDAVPATLNGTIPAGSYFAGNYQIAKQGYRPIGVVGWSAPNNGSVCCCSAYIAGSYLVCNGRNIGDASTSPTINFFVLFKQVA